MTFFYGSSLKSIKSSKCLFKLTFKTQFDNIFLYLEKLLFYKNILPLLPVKQYPNHGRCVYRNKQTFSFSLHFCCCCAFLFSCLLLKHNQKRHKTQFIIMFNGFCFCFLLSHRFVYFLSLMCIQPTVHTMRQSAEQLRPSCTSNFLWLSKCMYNFRCVCVCERHTSFALYFSNGNKTTNE